MWKFALQEKQERTFDGTDTPPTPPTMTILPLDSSAPNPIAGVSVAASNRALFLTS